VSRAANGADRVSEQAQAVQHHKHGPALVPQNRERQGQGEQQAGGDQHQHRADRKRQILPDDATGPPRQPMRLGQPRHVIGQKRDIGGLKRDLAAGRAHGDPRIGARQCSCIIHSVANERHLAVGGLFADQTDLVFGQEISIDVLRFEAELRTDAQADIAPVTGHHNDLVDARFAQRCQTRERTVARAVGDTGGAEDLIFSSQPDDRLAVCGDRRNVGRIDIRVHSFRHAPVSGPDRPRRIGAGDAFAGH